MIAETSATMQADPATGRWLVMAPAARQPRQGPSVRPEATFLAQLLAMRAGLPQARQRRRADPDVGAAAYRDGLALKRSRDGAAALDLDA